MKILTVKHPFAEQIISGEKRIENRSWGENVRGRIGIHCGGENGAIIGTVEVVDVLSVVEALNKYPEQGEYISGPLCWVLENPIAIEPIPCYGRLSFWEFTEDMRRAQDILPFHRQSRRP